MMIRLQTRCGCERELFVPVAPPTIDLPLRRVFIGMEPCNGGYVFERHETRRFEFDRADDASLTLIYREVE